MNPIVYAEDNRTVSVQREGGADEGREIRPPVGDIHVGTLAGPAPGKNPRRPVRPALIHHVPLSGEDEQLQTLPVRKLPPLPRVPYPKGQTGHVLGKPKDHLAPA